MDIYTSGTYAENNPGWADDEAEAKFSSFKLFLMRHLPAMSRDGRIAVLDVGCGSAGISHRMAKDLDDRISVIVDAYDISGQACEIARSKYGGNDRMKVHQGTIKDAPGTYDLLTCIDVIEHLYDYEGFLSDARSKARYVFFNVPIEVNLMTVLRPRAFQETYMRGGHVNFYNHEYFIFLLERTGFRIVDTGYSDAFRHIFKTRRAYFVYPFRRAIGLVNRKLAAALLGGYSLMVLAATGRE